MKAVNVILENGSEAEYETRKRKREKETVAGVRRSVAVHHDNWREEIRRVTMHPNDWSERCRR